MARAAVPTELRLEIEEFVAREAELLDERQLHDWLALFADDARYAVYLREPPSPPSPGVQGLPSGGSVGRSSTPVPGVQGRSPGGGHLHSRSPGVQGRSPGGGVGVSPND